MEQFKNQFGPYRDPKSTVGFYVPTSEFAGIGEHVAVMEEGTGKLLAVTGPTNNADPKDIIESLCEAVVYSSAHELFRLTQSIALDGVNPDHQEKAKAILVKMRHALDGCQFNPSYSSKENQDIKNTVHKALGLDASSDLFRFRYRRTEGNGPETVSLEFRSPDAPSDYSFNEGAFYMNRGERVPFTGKYSLIQEHEHAPKEITGEKRKKDLGYEY